MIDKNSVPIGEKGWPIGDGCARTVHSDKKVTDLLARVASGERLKDAAGALGIPYETAKSYHQGRRRELIPVEWRPRRIRRRK